MRLTFEDKLRQNVLDKLKECVQFKKLQDICDRHSITLVVDYTSKLQISVQNEVDIEFSADYSVSQDRWLIFVTNVNGVNSDVFAEQLTKVNEFFSCIKEVETVCVPEIYKFLDEGSHHENM